MCGHCLQPRCEQDGWEGGREKEGHREPDTEREVINKSPECYKGVVRNMRIVQNQMIVQNQSTVQNQNIRVQSSSEYCHKSYIYPVPIILNPLNCREPYCSTEYEDSPEPDDTSRPENSPVQNIVANHIYPVAIILNPFNCHEPYLQV
jgi:hypothetical protein